MVQARNWRRRGPSSRRQCEAATPSRVQKPRGSGLGTLCDFYRERANFAIELSSDNGNLPDSSQVLFEAYRGYTIKRFSALAQSVSLFCLFSPLILRLRRRLLLLRSLRPPLFFSPDNLPCFQAESSNAEIAFDVYQRGGVRSRTNENSLSSRRRPRPDLGQTPAEAPGETC